MQFMKAALASLSIVFASATAFAPAATAQGTTVVVIDQAKIMRDSAGGQDIRSKVSAIQQTILSELQPTQNELQSQSEALQAKTANMTREAMTQDQELISEAQDLQRKSQAFNERQQLAAAGLQKTENMAWRKFLTAMQPVLQEVVTEKGADVVLDSSSVIYSAPAINATDSVIMKMDAKMPTVEVVRQQVTREELQQAQQQQ